MTDAKGNDPRDVDARFHEIMDSAFGPDGWPEPSSPAPQRPTATPRDDFNLTEAMARVTPDDPAEPFVPEDPAPLPRPRGRAALGAALLAFSLLVAVAAMAGVQVGFWWGRLAVLTFAGGLVVLFTALPRRPRDPWDDGTRL